MKTELKTNDMRKRKSMSGEQNKVTVGACILNSTTPVHPLRHRLDSISVVKPMIQALSMARRGKSVHISNVSVTLLMTLIAPATM